MTESVQEQISPRPILAYVAILIALSSPLIQMALRPFLEGNFPDAIARFLSIWVFWIAVAVAYVVSVRIENIPLSTFGITRNTRSLRYRLIELIAALLLGFLVSIVVIGVSAAARSLLGEQSSIPFDPASIPPFWVMFPAWITASFAEEFLFRSYPIERLTMLTGNRWLAAAIGVIAFVLLHLVGWDWVHVLTVVFPAGVLLTAIYLWRRSLWFVVVIHGIVNVPLLLLPLLAPFL